MEGDDEACAKQHSTEKFLPTPSHGGRPCYAQGEPAGTLFLPTPSHGGRQGLAGERKEWTGDFYPRPHMEGDPGREKSADYTKISTHALTWRATKRHPPPPNDKIFLPTPSHGGRQKYTPRQPNDKYFCPRPHMEGDNCSSVAYCETGISTHALTWRATC